jgi:hypothetical protein
VTRSRPPANPRRAAVALLTVALALPSPSGAEAPEDERALDAVVIPAERSPSPKLPEWAGATRVRPTRISAAAAGCRVDVLREWLHVKCAGETFALSLLGGDLDGIAFWIEPSTKEGTVLMPLRRGGKHVVQLWKAGKDRAGGFAPEPTLLLQEYWLEGAAAPVLTLL